MSDVVMLTAIGFFYFAAVAGMGVWGWRELARKQRFWDEWRKQYGSRSESWKVER